MHKNGFKVILGKAVCGGVPNLDSYYCAIFNKDRTVKWFSRNMRSDEDCDDTIVGDTPLPNPSNIEFWNYDKMILMAEYKLDFHSQSRYVWQMFQ